MNFVKVNAEGGREFLKEVYLCPLEGARDDLYLWLLCAPLTSQFITHLSNFCLNYITIIHRDHQSGNREIDILRLFSNLYLIQCDIFEKRVWFSKVGINWAVASAHRQCLTKKKKKKQINYPFNISALSIICTKYFISLWT